MKRALWKARGRVGARTTRRVMDGAGRWPVVFAAAALEEVGVDEKGEPAGRAQRAEARPSRFRAFGYSEVALMRLLLVGAALIRLPDPFQELAADLWDELNDWGPEEGAAADGGRQARDGLGEADRGLGTLVGADRGHSSTSEPRVPFDTPVLPG